MAQVYLVPRGTVYNFMSSFYMSADSSILCKNLMLYIFLKQNFMIQMNINLCHSAGGFCHPNVTFGLQLLEVINQGSPPSR